MKRILSMFLVLAMTIMVSAADGTMNGTKVSDWAKPTVKQANALNLLPDCLGSDYKCPITRLQFAEMAVNFAEHISGNPISTNDIKFEDTKYPAALKAAAAGIVKGTGTGSTFSPDSNITREEIATMIYRTIQYVDKTALSPPVSLSKYADAKGVSQWAEEAMGSMVASGILKGASATELLPKDHTSIEQAIILIYRSYGQVTATLNRPMAKQYAESQKMIQGDLQKQYVGAGRTAATFTDSRVNIFHIAEVYNDISDHPGTYLLYDLDYDLKTDHPEYVFVAGGLEVDADGWMKVGLPTTLVFKKEATGFVLLGGFVTEFTPDGNAQIFRSDFEQWLGKEIHK